METIKEWMAGRFGTEKWPHFPKWHWYFRQFHVDKYCDCCEDLVERGTPMIQAYDGKTTFVNNTYTFCQDCGEKITTLHEIEIKPY
jgi:hypothetical protein